MSNLSRSSRCHCSARAGEHSTASRRASPWASSSAAISPASMVLPMPTSSAMSSRTASWRSAMQQRDELVGARLDARCRPRSGTGRPPERNPSRRASRSRPALAASPRSSAVGGANVAGSTPSARGRRRRPRRRRRRAGAARGSRGSLSGQHDPLAAAGPDEASRRRRSGRGPGAVMRHLRSCRVPNTVGCRATSGGPVLVVPDPQRRSSRASLEPLGGLVVALGCCAASSWMRAVDEDRDRAAGQVVDEVGPGRRPLRR